MIITFHFVGDTDYSFASFELSFDVGEDLRECTTLTIVDDVTLEPIETFSIFLTTNAIHSLQPAVVTIIDNDGV